MDKISTYSKYKQRNSCFTSFLLMIFAQDLNLMVLYFENFSLLNDKIREAEFWNNYEFKSWHDIMKWHERNWIQISYTVFLDWPKTNLIGKTGKKDKVKYRIGIVMNVYLIVSLARGNKRVNFSPHWDQDYRIFITCR